MIIPEQFSANCCKHRERQIWLDSLPAMLKELTGRWSLRAGPSNPIGTIKRLADLAEVDTERAQLWPFARAAADPRPEWSNMLWIDIARALAP